MGRRATGARASGSLHRPASARRSSLGTVTAGTSARVYVSHLSGIGVFDPAGDSRARCATSWWCFAMTASRRGCSAW